MRWLSLVVLFAACTSASSADVLPAGGGSGSSKPPVDAALADAPLDARPAGVKQGGTCAPPGAPDPARTRACADGLVCCRPGGYGGQASTCETKRRCLQLGQRP